MLIIAGAGLRIDPTAREKSSKAFNQPSRLILNIEKFALCAHLGWNRKMIDFRLDNRLRSDV